MISVYGISWGVSTLGKDLKEGLLLLLLMFRWRPSLLLLLLSELLWSVPAVRNMVLPEALRKCEVMSVDAVVAVVFEEEDKEM